MFSLLGLAKYLESINLLVLCHYVSDVRAGHGAEPRITEVHDSGVTNLEIQLRATIITGLQTWPHPPRFPTAAHGHKKLRRLEVLDSAETYIYRFWPQRVSRQGCASQIRTMGKPLPPPLGFPSVRSECLHKWLKIPARYHILTKLATASYTRV